MSMKPTIGLGRRARQRAISLIEGVLYLVIALAVIVGGIVFFQQAQLSNQITDSARAVIGISSQTRALYQNQRTFGTDDLTAALVASGSVPSNALDVDGNINLPVSGAVQVRGKGEDFAVYIPNMAPEACQRLLPVSESGEGVLGIGIRGIVIDQYETPEDPATVAFVSANFTEAEYSLPITPTDIETDCGAIADAGEEPDVLIVFAR